MCVYLTDDARSSVYIVDDDCSTLSHETTNSNESFYLNSKRTKRYNSIQDPDNDDHDLIGLAPSSRRRMSIPSDKIHLNTIPPATFWNTFNTRSKYYLPILQWIPLYNRHDFSQDMISGLSLAALFIPQALSYATALCKIPAIHGLYTISITTIVYACLGMSPQLSVGPEATVSLIVGSGIAHQQAISRHPFDPEAAAAIASLTALFTGLFTLALGLLRFGFLDSLMSRSLLRGFVTAVAILVLVQQSISLLGLNALAVEAGLTPDSTTIQRLLFVFSHFNQCHRLTSAFSLGVLFILIIWGYLKPKHKSVISRIPEVLVVVIASIVICRSFHLDQSGLDILGQVGHPVSGYSSPLPIPSVPKLPEHADIKAIIVNAAIITIIGFVESVAAAKTFARKHTYFVSANRELVALGIANIFGSMFQSFPAFGSFPRSKVHESLRPKTQMSGLLSGLTCILVTSLLLPQLFYLPNATLSCIIFLAALALLRELPDDLRFIVKVRAWKDVALMATTFLTTMFFSLEMGTAVAVMFSLLITVQQSSYPRVTILGRVKETAYEFQPMHHLKEKVEHLKNILIVRIEEPLNFANTGQLKDRLRRLELFGDMAVHPSEQPRRHHLTYIVLDLGGMEFIDASAVQILYEIIQSYHEQRVTVILVNGQPNAMELIHRAGIVELIGHHFYFKDVTDAIKSIEEDLTYTSFPTSHRMGGNFLVD
ncbi:hypothetical protein INT47_008610 [Mucor saturninus]|uniref:STAS domain-containing protein n=1 Tax=Mucor saturninus TaxID=64648 RepID=A0A8H7QTL5_9FUNG|nr:hypothetical protein INT47_008610 [Mucor saturninus]